MLNSLKIVSVIPARGGSKGILNKNIRELNGQPLISYSILDSLSCKSIQETYISTDSQEIADISKEYGAEVPFLRPKKFAKDDSPDLQWANHFIWWFRLNKGYYPDCIIHLRPTTPFRCIKLIDLAIQSIQKNPKATALISLEEYKEVYKTFKIEGKFLGPIFDWKYNLMPRQKIPKAYRANGYVDILKSETILGGQLHGNKILGLITARTAEIDDKEDFEYATWKAKQLH